MQISDVVAHLSDCSRSKSAEITFIIGAGASVSAGIPTAPTLVEAITEKFPHCLTELRPDDRGDYGKVMGALTPNQRRGLIEPLLADAKLNWGHLALACLVRELPVRRILSFNFDFLIEQAMTLLGEHLPVYDCGASRIDHIENLADKALFHLHGQSYGITLLNSEDETKAHVDRLKPLFSNSLHNHLTIVAGYSGKADAAFSLFESEYTGNERLIWLGYDDEPADNLKQLCEARFFSYIGGCDFDRTMIVLARGLGCWPPQLIENPPRHALSLLSKLPSFPVGEDETTNVIEGTRRRLETFIENWESGRTEEEVAAEALISGNVPPGPFRGVSGSPEADLLIAWGYVEAGNALVRKAAPLAGAEKRAALESGCATYEAALEIKQDMHEALYNWGNALLSMAELFPEEEKLRKLEEAVSKYVRAIAIKPDKDEAYNNWGSALLSMAKLLPDEEKLKKFEEAVTKFERAIAIKQDDHQALYNCGNALYSMAELLPNAEKLRKFEEAVSKYERVIAIKPDDHQALYNCGTALYSIAKLLPDTEKLRKLEEAASKYERVIAIKPDDHQAFYNCGTVLYAMAKLLPDVEKFGKLEEALANYERATAIKPDKYEAYNNWGNALLLMVEFLPDAEKLRISEEAVSKYERVIAIKPDDHQAIYNCGTALLSVAELLPDEEKIEKLAEAASKYKQAIAVRSDFAEAHHRLGLSILMSIEFLETTSRIAKWREASHCFKQVKKITGKASYWLAVALSQIGESTRALEELEDCAGQGMLPDPHTLATDENFIALRDTPRFQKLFDGMKHS